MLVINIATMAVMSNSTSIMVSRKTRDRLAKIGEKGSTFDEIIQKLLSEWEASQ